MDEPIITIENVSKRFRRNMTTFLRILGYTLGIPSPDDFWALEDVSFKVQKGEAVGIIGANGAGKSTLLKVIAGIVKPTKGSVTVRGRIGALIEVGAGFNPELTGRENIFLYGAILGMTKKEIRERFDEIVDFSGLGHMLDTPVKFYSSGMYLRLGFSVTVFTDPDILIIDEAMAVGDGAFQEKSFRKIRELQASGKTVILVSHDTDLIQNYTQRCVVLKDGAPIFSGDSKEGIQRYMQEYTLHASQPSKTFESMGRDIYIAGVTVQSDSSENTGIQTASDLCLEIEIRSTKYTGSLQFSLAIYRDGKYLFGIHEMVTIFKTQSTVRVTIPHHPFLEGKYAVAVGIWQSSFEEKPLDLLDPALFFSVAPFKGKGKQVGYLFLPHTLETR